MTRFAPVGPIQILEGLHAAGQLGDYHLLLAHHTVEHKARFTDLFKRLGDTHDDIVVIMDNSIVELGESVCFDVVAEATQCIVDAGVPHMAVIPVLPDVMGNGIATRAAVQEAYAQWSKDMPGDGLMAVCQGENLNDYLRSLDLFANSNYYPGITWLGIPRVLHKTCGTRLEATAMAAPMMLSHKIHLLGFCDDIRDDLAASCFKQVTGIDSAVPLRIREVFSEFIDAGKRDPDWFEKAQVDQLMLQNLKITREMFA